MLSKTYNKGDLEVNILEDENQVSLSVVVPVFNEEKGIEGVVKELHAILTSLGVCYEIIVVDDCSNDRSPEILQQTDGILYVRHDKNLGYGGSLKTGIRKARGNIIVITDGDGTYPNESIPELIKEISNYHMVVGARAKDDPNIPLLRKPAKWFLAKLANYLAETDIPDLNSGLRVFRKDLALQFHKMLPSGFSFTTTITLAMLCNGYYVKYIPIKYRDRQGKSKIRPIRDTINFIQLIGRTIMYFNPLKVFLPLDGLLLIGFLVSLFIDILILGNLTDKTVILFVAVVQIFVIGMVADLIDKRMA